MKHVGNNRFVCEAWLNGQDWSRSGSMSHEGDMLFSYRTQIGHIYHSGDMRLVIRDVTKFSPSTGRHQRDVSGAVGRICPEETVAIVVDCGGKFQRPWPTPEQMVADTIDWASKQMDKLEMTSWSTKILERAVRIASWFDLPVPTKTDVFMAWEKREDARLAKNRDRRAAMAAWRRGEHDDLPYDAPQMWRINDGEIESNTLAYSIAELRPVILQWAADRVFKREATWVRESTGWQRAFGRHITYQDAQPGPHHDAVKFVLETVGIEKALAFFQKHNLLTDDTAAIVPETVAA